MRFQKTLFAAGLLIASSAVAGTIVYGNNASFNGTETIEAFDLSTGAQVANFIVPNAVANRNGRGIAVVGTTIYYSNSDSGNVYKTNSVNHSDDGIAFTTNLSGIANIAFDGTALYVTGYNGTNNAYRYSLGGTLLQTVAGFGNSRDGFEVANNNLIANRGDGEHVYDLYKLDGTLSISAFIDVAAKVTNFAGITTGITFDGTNYIISNPDGFSGPTTKLLIFDASGNYVRTQALAGSPAGAAGLRLLEDLSSLGNIPTNPPVTATPEPVTFLLLGSGFAGIAMVRARSRKV